MVSMFPSSSMRTTTSGVSALPLQIPLLAAREIAHFHVLLQHEGTILEASQAFRQHLNELGQMRLTRPNLDDWSRRSFNALKAMQDLAIDLMTNAPPAFLEELGADLEKQRKELAVFLAPIGADTHADYAICALALSLHASFEHLAKQPFDLRAEWARMRDTVDPAGLYGAVLRIMSFLTLALENARAGLPASERDAVYARSAFLEAAAVVQALATDGVVVDPTTYMRTPRAELARGALQRLIATDASDESRAFFNSLWRD